MAGGISNWVKTEVIAPIYDSFEKPSGVNKKAVSEKAFQAVMSLRDTDHEKFMLIVTHAVHAMITRSTNQWHTKARSERGGEIAEHIIKPEIPGMEDVKKDKVNFELDGIQYSKRTWELSLEEVEAVLEDYLSRQRGLASNMRFYAALRDEMVSNGVNRVKDLYRG